MRAALVMLPLAFISAPVSSQTPADQSSPPPGAAPPVIQSTTRLVQVSVVARDKDGSGAEGLKSTDFRVSADGRPQKIAFFSVESTGHVPAANPPLPPHTFTNLLAARGQQINSITVVLFDLVNTKMTDRMYARQQLLKYLGEVQPQDRIGVYVFNGHIRVLHDYTADMTDLQRRIAAATQRLMNVTQNEEPGALDHDDGDFAEMLRGGGNAQEREFFMRDRVLGTLEVFKFIANHLAQVPGRKNVIWVSGGFPTLFGYEHESKFSDDFIDEIDATVRALSDANVAIYPIDARGLVTPPGYDASRNSPSGASSASSGRASTRPPRSGNRASDRLAGIHETMDDLAHRTGGRAYYNTNDLAKAIHDAVSDSTLTYTLGFYPENEKHNREFHKIKVEVERAHVNLHYRSGYLDLPLNPVDDRLRMVQLHDALWSPLEATELGLIAQAGFTSPGAAARSVGPAELKVSLNIKPDGIIIKQVGDRYTGHLDVLMIPFDARGNQLDGPQDTIDLNMLSETYKRFLVNGVPLNKTLNLSQRAATLRIVVRDAGSGMIGSLTVPVTEL
jgi:VWFA-related protein